jgi:hypothetical protein
MAEEQLITNPDAAISQRNQYPPQSGPENTRGNGVRVRRGIAAGFVVLLAAARMRYPALALGGQAAVSLSNYGQENITFWCNHSGLEQLDVEGEVGFGDLARILLRRRSNVDHIRKLRFLFTFKDQDMRRLKTPDVFSASMSKAGPVWENKPMRVIAAAGQTFNVPVIVTNDGDRDLAVEGWYKGASMDSSFPASKIAAGGVGGYFLRAVETQPGLAKGRVVLRVGGRDIEAPVEFDVRPVVTLRVKIVDETGQPGAARVYVTGSDGMAYVPRGSISRITAISAEYYFHAQGSFEVQLPAGLVRIEATRGLEYEVSSTQIELTPGETER